ncbi:hypothetical protein EI94DRAFT_1703018 [Lactarius quietus]|nr:hypothetical protein EI94DRAFT_1703018 [Lactarius quietus]
MTMLQEFANCYHLKTSNTFDVKCRQIRCLAHMINLATQAVIATRSKSKHYNGDPSDDHLPEDLETDECDEIGIACSSSQRKALFKSIQIRGNVPPVNLLLDMKVQWSSTYVMLRCAMSHQQSIDKFILGLGLKEVNTDKRRKISALVLSEEEWTQVRLFCNILQQQRHGVAGCKYTQSSQPPPDTDCHTQPNRSKQTHCVNNTRLIKAIWEDPLAKFTDPPYWIQHHEVLVGRRAHWALPI